MHRDTLMARGQTASSTDWLLVATPGISWGASFLFIAEGLKSVGPYGVTFIRIAIGFATLALFRAARKPIERSAWRGIALLGILWFAFPLSLFPLAEQRVSSALTGMLNAVTPLFVAMVAAAIARRFPSARVTVGLLTGIAGSVLIALPSIHEGRSSTLGVALILLACAFYGFALNLARPLQQKYGALPVVWRALGIAALLTAVFGLPEVVAAHWKPGPLLSLLALGIAGTGVAFVLIGMAAGRVGATRASAAAFLIPPVSLLLGVAVRGERVALLSIIGSAICVAGAWMIRPQQAKPQNEFAPEDVATGEERWEGKDVSPELAAFIDAVTKSADSAEQSTRTVPAVIQNEARSLRGRALLADVSDEIAPYGCGFRPIPRIRSAIAGGCAGRDAIGHHGLT